jgi:hypothetical protein
MVAISATARKLAVILWNFDLSISVTSANPIPGGAYSPSGNLL